MTRTRVKKAAGRSTEKARPRRVSRKRAPIPSWPTSHHEASGPRLTAADLLAALPVAPEAALKEFRKLGLINESDSARLLRRWSVFESALELFAGNFAEARRWLQSPARGLGNRVPLEVAGTATGATQVRDLIGRLEHGVFA